MEWYIKCLKNYAKFDGRSHRTEYWMFFLFNFLAMFALGFIEGFLGLFSNSDQSVLSSVYLLAVLIPGIAVGVRRMHDTNHSGWWIIIPIVNLVFACSKGTEGDNQFGPDPSRSLQGK